jgi:hypothetical protein
MKTVNLATTPSNLEDLLDLAGKEAVLLKTAEGREFILTEVDDDFDKEIESVRQNRGLLEFLDHRSGEKEALSLKQVRERLKLT